MRKMNQHGKLTEPGLPKVQPIKTAALDARSQLKPSQGARTVQKQGWGKARMR